MNETFIQSVSLDSFKTDATPFSPRKLEPNATYIGIEEIGAFSNVPIM